ncbi:MAG: hypothetical protein HY753_04845 [Nitrospirae bacterium]|nr:hypothetical protein [Nitrospirota bacterium]
MKNAVRKLFIKEKLLIIIYKMSLKKRPLKYEDVYVKAFKKYPIDFQLRGYPAYPDTEIMLLHSATEATDIDDLSKTLSRDIMNQIDRIKNTEAYQLFATDKKEQIVDTDIFTYLGTTVRTERTDFNARIKTVQDVIENIKKNPDYKVIVELHNYLFEKFKDLMKIKLSIGYPRRKT